jgi:ADP-ribosylglycohydrolase
MSEIDGRDERSARGRLSLDGLSIGDAFGQRFFHPWVMESAAPDNLPDPPWHYTDDTEMAMAIVQVLEEVGRIDEDLLARRFAERYAAEPGRGYGAGAAQLLREVGEGGDWRTSSRNLFGGSGSFGNGGAMRAAPLGAWFADDPERVASEAALSGEVTHAHPEGQAGAIAVALAACWAWRWQSGGRQESPAAMLKWIADRTPETEVRAGIERAAKIPLDAWAFDVARELGCGDQVSAMDTVSFCLWMAAAHLTDYENALWTTARVGGDIDTNCAIVGGIVALAVGAEGIPSEWKRRREGLNW